MELSNFLAQVNTNFSAQLSDRGGYITFGNSGRRGEIKYFQLGLDSLLITLKDIKANIIVFRHNTIYNETQWRDIGPSFFTDEVVKSTSTVQTKPLFTLLNKIICWANDILDYSDNTIHLDDIYLDNAIFKLEELAQTFTPERDKNYNYFNDEIKFAQKIYYGAPGTGKSHNIKIITTSVPHVRTTFHPDSDYSTFVGAYKPTMCKVELRDVTGKVIMENGEKVLEDRIIYNYVPQAFLKSYIKAWEIYPNSQVLVVEEINRGNCAQVFGDLFQLLDRGDSGFSDYPISADSDISKYLSDYFAKNGIAENLSEHKVVINSLYPEYNGEAFDKIMNGELLALPSNLSIYATMNTSDQSLFPIDSAFKRRWEWVYIPIKDAGKDWTIQVNGDDYDWWSFVEKINEKIYSTTNSEDKKLGYFFVKADNENVISAERFVGKVIFYLWNDVFKDYGFDDDIFTDSTDNSQLTFQKFYNFDGTVNEDTIDKFLTNLKVDEYDDSDPSSDTTESKKQKIIQSIQ